MNKQAGLLTTRSERMSYGSFFVGQNIIYILVLSFLAQFYTDEVGLAPAAVATLFLVARVWDAVNDPMLGALVDKCNLKGGRFKPWINAVAVLMPLVTIALFYNIGGSSTSNLIYAYVTYILWGMIYTVSDVPIFALATAMTDNLDERVSLISIGRLAAGIAGMIASVAAAPIIGALGWTGATLVLMAIALVTMIPIRFFTKERIVYDRQENVSIKTMFEAVYKNKYLLIYYSAFIVMMSFNTGSAVGTYFATYNLGNFDLFSVVMLVGILPMMIIPVFLPKLITMMGKKKLFLVTTGVGILVTLAQYFIGYSNFALFLVLSFIKGFALYTPMMMMGLFSADCAEYGAYVTGKRNEGITFSIQTFSTKLGTAFAGFFGTMLLGYYGYVANAAQSERAMNGIWKLMTLYPVIGMVIGFVIIYKFYDLEEADVKRMIDEMQMKAS
ncbi:MFS transporter [Acidaminobacter sp. JC074]|uniref:glycoside-pentoside-hexuronide (GPH):cation symporter n=1 Tax=Acidaminobacter sp. JC074 TaxID=2530199 RepID=UPI001F0FD457|nr:glycoside-pentoside-hexuronide (GPH):cation symporter [Acidaminobacter sp. JC074]MCH4888961.1 MFS transporter [Acidaminobacter sp. JC074]